MDQREAAVTIARFHPLPWRPWLQFITLFCLFFFPVYAAGLWRGASIANPAVLAFGWERQWPLIPWMIVPYLTLFTAYWVPLFLIPATGFAALTRQSLFVILVSGLVFWVMPTQSGFAPQSPTATFGPLFALMGAIDRPYNLMPSLHVAGATVVLLASAQFAARPVALGLKLWLALIAVSTLCVHQHHLIDLVTGIGLALIARRLFPVRPPGDAATVQAESRSADR
jgi:membrane-associated phospholipid phosphatase